jgi:hypothetical protein
MRSHGLLYYEVHPPASLNVLLEALDSGQVTSQFKVQKIAPLWFEFFSQDGDRGTGLIEFNQGLFRKPRPVLSIEITSYNLNAEDVIKELIGVIQEQAESISLRPSGTRKSSK